MTDETTPLIPTNERGAGPRTCGAQSEAARKSLRADVIAASAVLFFAGALVVAFPVHKHPHVPMDYYAKTAYPYTHLRLGSYDANDVLRTAREARGFARTPERTERWLADRSAWMADPGDATVFQWKDGEFTMNLVKPTASELGMSEEPVTSDAMIKMWETHDYAGLGAMGGEGKHARVFKAFSALVVGAMHHAPERFRPGQPPFRVVTHQRDYLAPPCVSNVPKGSRFHPCPVAKAWRAPVFNFGSALKNGDVFPAEVNMPDPEFIDAVLRNQRPAQAETSPLGVSQDGLAQATYSAQPTRPWKDRVGVVAWRGADVPHAPKMPFGADSGVRGEACASLLRSAGSMPEGDVGAYVAGNRSVASPDRVTSNQLAAWAGSERGGDFARRLTPRWRAVLGSLSQSPEASVSPAAAALGISPVSVPRKKRWLDARFTVLAPNAPCSSALPDSIIGARMTHDDKSAHKYLLDIGGVGGSGWMGTLSDLATGALVFRVESPTADFYDGELKEGTHYVGVKPDLSDLREKYEWAQANQEEAFAIASAGAKFAKEANARDLWDRFVSRPMAAARAHYDAPGQLGEHGRWEDEGAEELERNLVPIYRYAPQGNIRCDDCEESRAVLGTILMPDAGRVAQLASAAAAASGA